MSSNPPKRPQRGIDPKIAAMVKKGQKEAQKEKEEKEEVQSHVNMNGKRKKISEMSQEDWMNMSESDIEAYMMQSYTNLCTLESDYSTKQKLLRYGTTNPNTSFYRTLTATDEWLRGYMLAIEKFPYYMKDYSSSPAFADMGKEKILLLDTNKQIPFPNYYEAFEPFACGYSNWKKGENIGYAKDPDDLYKQNPSSTARMPTIIKNGKMEGAYECTGKDIMFFYKVPNVTVFEKLKKIAYYVVKGLPIPDELLPYKVVDGNKIYLTDEGLHSNLNDFIKDKSLEGLALAVVKGGFGDMFLPIGDLEIIMDSILGKENYLILVSNVKIDNTGGVTHYICRGMYLDVLGTFRYGQVNITCKFGGDRIIAGGTMYMRSVQSIMKRTLIMAAYSSFKSLSGKKMPDGRDDPTSPSNCMKKLQDSIRLKLATSGMRLILGGEGEGRNRPRLLRRTAHVEEIEDRPRKRKFPEIMEEKTKVTHNQIDEKPFVPVIENEGPIIEEKEEKEEVTVRNLSQQGKAGDVEK